MLFMRQFFFNDSLWPFLPQPHEQQLNKWSNSTGVVQAAKACSLVSYIHYILLLPGLWYYRRWIACQWLLQFFLLLTYFPFPVSNILTNCRLLDNNNLSGSLPPELYKLPNLLILYVLHWCLFDYAIYYED